MYQHLLEILVEAYLRTASSVQFCVPPKLTNSVLKSFLFCQ